MNVAGWTALATPAGQSAVLVPDNLVPSLGWDSIVSVSEFTWASAAVISDLGAVSTYFPHSGRPEDFLVAMHDIEPHVVQRDSKVCLGM